MFANSSTSLTPQFSSLLNASPNNFGLESQQYVLKVKRQWGDSLPRAIKVIEFAGTGDRAFGGQADDRVLTVNGAIAQGTVFTPAFFSTIEEAHEAAVRIPNRRRDSRLGVLPIWQ
jgi:hypothetical protein